MDTKTWEDWVKYVGRKPSNMGVVARYYTNHTITFLTDGLKNVYYNNEKESKFLMSDSLVFEWEIENNQIKHVEFAREPEYTSEGNREITFYFNENYYRKYDIFRIDETLQQIQVLYNPVRKADNLWAVTGVLVANNFDTYLDMDGCLPGMTTTFLSTANVELSEEGYSKFLSAFEKHRNYMTFFRHDVSWSSLYALQELVFMKISDDKDKNKGESIYKMHKKEKELLDTFMYSLNTGLLLNKGNIDVNGKATHQDPDSHRPITFLVIAA